MQQHNVTDGKKLTVQVTAFKSVRKNTLVGFVEIRIPQMKLTVKDVSIHQKDSSRWVALPSKPQVDTASGTALRDSKTGKIAYTPILSWDNKATSDAFSAAVIAALLQFAPEAFGSAP